MAIPDETRPRAPDSETCARLNDDCRWKRGDLAGVRHMTTIGVKNLICASDFPTQILRTAALQHAIRHYSFCPGDGSERDFGSFEFLGERLMFKIDAYDRNLEWGSPDPADAAVTTRVLTIMLSSEY